MKSLIRQKPSLPLEARRAPPAELNRFETSLEKVHAYYHLDNISWSSLLNTLLLALQHSSQSTESEFFSDETEVEEELQEHRKCAGC